MKYLSNTTKSPIHYKGVTIPPKASVMLNNKGEVVDEIRDYTEDLEKLRGEVSNAVTAAQFDARLEEIECKTNELATSASKPAFDLGSISPIYDEACLHRTDGRPVELFSTACCFPLNIEPGLYLGRLPENSKSSVSNISLGDVWEFLDKDNKYCGSCSAQPVCFEFSVRPALCYKTRYCFCGGGAIFEIDEEAAKMSYVCVCTTLKEQNAPDSRGCYHWGKQINKPFECVKKCFDFFDTWSVCLSCSLTRLL